MAAPNQAVVFEVQVEVARARAELASLGKGAETMGGGLDKLNKGLNRFDAATREAQKVVRGLGDAMGGTKSQAAEMIGVAADLGGAFASGGLFGVGMAAGLYAVTQLTRAWNMDKQAAQQWSRTLRETVKTDVESMLTSMNALNKEIVTFGLSGREAERGALQAYADESASNAEFFKKDIAEREEVIRRTERTMDLARQGKTRGGKNYEGEVATQRLLIEGSKAKLAAEESDLAVAREKLSVLDTVINKTNVFAAAEKRRQDAEEAARKAKQDAGRITGSGRDLEGSDSIQNQLNAAQSRTDAIVGAEIAAEQTAREQYAKDMAEQDAQLLTESAQINSELLQQAQTWQDAHTEVERAGIEERQRLYEEDLAFRTQIGAEAIGIGVGATQSLLDGLITGQEHALELFAVSVMKQAGSAMIGHGINALAGGIAANSLIPGSGVVAMGTGAGLIAGGLTLGGIGTGVEHTMVNGGQLFKALPDPTKDKSTSDRGVNSGRPGASSGAATGGGQTVINVTYSAAGPMPEQTGREVAKALETLRRRQGLTPVRQGPNA